MSQFGDKKRRGRIDHLQMGKVLPNAVDLEGAILGALLLNPSKLIDVMPIIDTPESFYLDAHNRIYAAILRLNDKGTRIDFMTLTQELKSTEELDRVGGSYFVTSLTKDVVSAANIEEHCRIIMQKFYLRELIRLSAEAINESYEESIDIFDLLDKVEMQLYAINKKIADGRNKPMSKIVHSTLDKIFSSKEDGKKPLYTYFREWDKVNGGRLQRGCIYFIAARPGMGKTSALVSMTLMQSKHFPVGIWNGELTEERFMNRYLCQIGSIPMSELLKEADDISDEIKKNIMSSAEELINLKLNIDCTENIELKVLKAKMRYWVYKHGVELIHLDYLQRISLPDEITRYMPKEQQVGYILLQLNALIKELDIPCFLYGQLNRDVLKLADKVPNLGHLKESGRIEEFVYQVALLNRPEYYGIMDDDYGRTKGRFDIGIEKNSDAKTGKIHLRSQLQFFKVYEEDEYEFLYILPDNNSTKPGEMPF